MNIFGFSVKRKEKQKEEADQILEQKSYNYGSSSGYNGGNPQGTVGNSVTHSEIDSAVQKSSYNGSRKRHKKTSYRGKIVGFETIIKEGFLSNSDVYSVIQKMINKAIDIPYHVYRYDSEGQKIEINEGAVVELLKSPNETESFVELMTKVYGYFALTGNAIILKEESVGFGTRGLRVLETQLVSIDQESRVYSYSDPILQQDFEYSPEEIIHIKYFSPATENICTGMGQAPLQACFMTVDAGNDLREAEQFVLNNLAINGIFTVDSKGTTLNQGVQDQLQRVADGKFGGVENTNSVMVIGTDGKYHKIDSNANQIKLLESRGVKLRDVTNCFGFDSKMFNDPDSTTYNNISEARKDFYTEGLMPFINRVLLALNYGLSEILEEGAVFIEADYSGVEALQTDQFTEVRKDSLKVKSLTDLLTSALSDNQKVVILVNEFEYTQEEATKLVQSDGTESN